VIASTWAQPSTPAAAPLNSLPHNLARVLVFAQAYELAVPQMGVTGPLNELKLAHGQTRWSNPVTSMIGNSQGETERDTGT
jgi:hypothetical protein